MRHLVLAGLCVLFAVALTSFSDASSWRAKTDHVIAALDLRTGKLLWKHKPKTLGEAHFRLYKGAIVAYPHYDGTKTTAPIVLTESGTLAAKQKTPRAKVLAKSSVHWPLPHIQLSNNWELFGFKPGHDKELKFRDRKSKKLKWRITTNTYPHQVRAWNDYVFYATSYLSDDGILQAYKAGETKPAWRFDLNKIVKNNTPLLTRMSLEVIDDVIYIQSREHIFALSPRSGKLLWHRDLATDLGLKYQPEIYGGGLDLAIFASEGNMLVISFEKRLIVLNTKTMKYLWHMDPGTFPHTPYPVVHKGKLYLTLGNR